MRKIGELCKLRKSELTPALLEEESIIKWKRKLRKESTFANSIAGMRRFITFLGTNPANHDLTLEDLLVEAETSEGRGTLGEKSIDRLWDFFTWLCGGDSGTETPTGYSPPKKRIKWNSARTASFGQLRGWFRHNGCKLPIEEQPVVRRSKVKDTDLNVPLHTETTDRETGLTINLLQAFYNELGKRDGVILACMYSGGGMDLTDLLSLKIYQVKFQTDPNIFIAGNRQKTGREYRVFFSEEASRYLRQYLKNKRKDANNDDYVFIPDQKEHTYTRTRQNAYGREEEVTETITAGGRLTPSTVSQNFLKAARTLGFADNGSQSEFRPKRFRSLFSNMCVKARIDRELIKLFQGHQGAISGIYTNLTREQLLEYYKEVEPLLEINKSPTAAQTSSDVVALKAENQQLTRRLDYIEHRLETLYQGLSPDLALQRIQLDRQEMVEEASREDRLRESLEVDINLEDEE